MDAIAKALLDQRLLLTALELHAELSERGEGLPLLRDYFDNLVEPVREHEPPQPSATRSASGSSLDSARADTPSRASFTESQDVAHEQDERVAVLEYELRKANDTIDKLRARLTSMATADDATAPAAAEHPASSAASRGARQHESATTINGGGGGGGGGGADRRQLTIGAKPVETRTLNYLVNEYLRDRGQKMAAITFANENDDQDLEDWRDVGVDLPPPPPLVELLRAGLRRDEQRRSDAAGSTTGSASTSASATVPESKLAQELHHAKEQNASLRARIMALEKVLREQADGVPTAAAHAASAPAVDGRAQQQQQRAASPLPHAEPTRDLHAAQKTVKWLPMQAQLIAVTNATGNPRLEVELAKLMQEDQSTVMIAASCLPNVIPNVLLNKRDELIPILLSVIKHHPEHATRDMLTNQLFTLSKKPDDAFRNIIITGCLALAQSIQPDRVETELLPQLWEQVGHKHPERRALVAESCGTLAAYVKPELRSSLIFSIVQQLYNDKTDFVREAVARNLALLLTHIEHAPEKLPQIREMVMAFVRDEHPKVVERTLQWLLPVFAKWARDQEDFMGPVLMWVTKDALKQLEKHDSLTVLDKANVLPDKELKALESDLVLLAQLARHAAADVFLSAPFAAKIMQEHAVVEQTVDTVLFPPPAALKALQAKFDDHVNAGEHSPSWPLYRSLVDEFLPSVLALVGSCDVINAIVYEHLNDLLRAVHAAFGATFARQVVKPLFASHMDAPEQASIEGEVEEHRTRLISLRRRLLPCYLGSVLVPIGVPTMVAYVRHVAIEVAQGLHHWSARDMDVLLFALRTICATNTACVTPLCELCEHDLVPHPSPQVRAVTVPLLRLLFTLAEPATAGKRLLPALHAIASDSDRQVQESAIAGYGAAIETVVDPELLEQLVPQLLAYSEDATHQVRVDLVKTFTASVAKADAAFRDEFIFPVVLTLVDANKRVENRAHREQLARLFVDAFKTLSCCYLSEAVIYEVLQPGLRLAIKELELLGGDLFMQSGALHDLLQQSDVKLYAAGVKKGDAAPSFPKKERVFKSLERRFPNWVEYTAALAGPAGGAAAAGKKAGITSNLTSGWKNLHQKLDLKL